MPDLTTRPLGDSGMQVSVVGLGCNNFGRRLDLEGTRAVVDAALENGINFFDTADIYGARAERGASRPAARGPPRSGRAGDQVRHGYGRRQGSAGARASYIAQAVEASLRRLRTDVIDVYWYHQPDGADADRGDAGDARRAGPGGQGRGDRRLELRRRPDRGGRLGRTRARLRRFIAVQNEYSLLKREAEHDVCRLRAAGPRLRALLPAGLGPAHRQVPARRAGAGGVAALADASRSPPTSSSISSKGWMPTRASGT